MTDTILFIDTTRWNSFDQFSAALRRRGTRTVRITTQQGRFSRLVSRASYDEHHILDRIDHLGALLARIDLDRVVDVQCPETLLTAVHAAVSSASDDPALVSRLQRRLGHLDKAEVSRILADNGIDRPMAAPGSTPPADAVAALGSPLMVKGRIGHGGIGVVSVEDAPEAEQAVERLGGPDAVYFEQLVEGEVVQYAACRRGSETLVEAAYASTRRDPRSLGAATTLHIVDDERLLRLGRAVLDAVGEDGLANIDVMRRRDGALLVIDVNLRVWSSAAALDAAGFDFVSAYQVALGRSEPVASRRRRAPRRSLDVFPDAALAEFRDGRPRASLALFALGFRASLTGFGIGYTLGATAALLRDVRDTMRHRAAVASADADRRRSDG